MAEKKKLKIMVSSTVYGSQDILTQIAAILRQQFGYQVIMSMEGSIYIPVEYMDCPEKACIKAVEECDLFLGIIFPRYGSGITHKEFKEAIRLDRPRWFVAHEKIEYLRKLFEPYLFDKMSEANREQMTLLSSTLWKTMLDNIVKSRKISADSLNSIADNLLCGTAQNAVEKYGIPD